MSKNNEEKDVEQNNIELRDRWISDVLKTIPYEYRSSIIVNSGCAAGPGFVAGQRQQFLEKTTIVEGLKWLEPRSRWYRRAHLELEDGTVLYFHPSSFYSAKVKNALVDAPSLEHVMTFALEKHALQKYGEHPYSFHLKAVQEVLHRFNQQDPFVLASAWLHDVIEDQQVSSHELNLKFGKKVSATVWAVTSPNDALTREAKFQQVFTKIRGQDSNDAKIVKLADRIANVEACRTSDPKGKFQTYKLEHAIFESNLRVGEHLEPMWVYLNSLIKK